VPNPAEKFWKMRGERFFIAPLSVGFLFLRGGLYETHAPDIQAAVDAYLASNKTG
jgi:hypothetical protein